MEGRMAARIARTAKERGRWAGMTKADRIFFTEIFRLMEQAALHDYPNPERKGCPSQEKLEAFARDPRSFSLQDPIFDHVPHCSNCYRYVHARRPAHYIN